MKETYIAVDIEASGTSPGKYAMLSLGACVVGAHEKTFYAEIKPISFNYIRKAMRVASQGLRCLKEVSQISVYNPQHAEFKPRLVLYQLKNKGETPRNAMRTFKAWAKQVSCNSPPILLANPTDYDNMFIRYYLDNYAGGIPFHHAGLDIKSFYKGFSLDLNASIKELGLRKGELTHNALEDAIQQATEFEKILEFTEQKKHEFEEMLKLMEQNHAEFSRIIQLMGQNKAGFEKALDIIKKK